MVCQVPSVPAMEKINFENLNGEHFIYLLIFMFLINSVYFGYRVYKTYVENKKFSGIYEFIRNQSVMNENWDRYIKGLTERFIREAPKDQIRIITKYVFKDALSQIIDKTRILIELNGLSTKNNTETKIRIYIDNIYNNLRTELDLFFYNGRRLSVFMCRSWHNETLLKVVECVYGSQDIEALVRSFDDLEKQIRLDFLKKMSGNTNEENDYD